MFITISDIFYVLECPMLKRFQCDDNTCVLRDSRCNGVPECPDNSDEKNCGKKNWEHMGFKKLYWI